MKKKSWESGKQSVDINVVEPSEIVKAYTIVLKQEFSPAGIEYFLSKNDNGELIGGFDLSYLKSSLGVIITDLDLKPLYIKSKGLLSSKKNRITGSISDTGLVTLNAEPACNFYIHYVYLLTENSILKGYVREDVGFNLSGVFDIGTDSIYVVSDVYRDLKSEDVFNNTATLSSFLRYVGRKLRKIDFSHNHHKLYYPKDDIDEIVNFRAKLDHSHTEQDITDLDKFTREEVTKLLTVYDKKGHRHDEWYLLKSEVYNLLKMKAGSVHSHFWADIDKRRSKLSDLSDVLSYKGNEGSLLSVKSNGLGTEWVSIPSKAVDISVNIDGFTGLFSRQINTVQDALKVVDSLISDKRVSKYTVYSSMKIEELLTKTSKKKHSHVEFYTQSEVNSLLERKADNAVFFKPNNIVLFSNKGGFLDSGLLLDDLSRRDHTHLLKDIHELDYTILKNTPEDDNLHLKDVATNSNINDEVFIYSRADNSYKRITIQNCVPYGSNFNLFTKTEIVCFGKERSEFQKAFGNKTDFLSKGLYKVEFSFMYSTIDYFKLQTVVDDVLKEFRLDGKSSDECVPFCYNIYIEVDIKKQIDFSINVKSVIGTSITLKDISVELIKVKV